MKKWVVTLVFVSLFSTAHAQEKPFVEKSWITQKKLLQFWSKRLLAPTSTNLGFLIDGGSIVEEKCNASLHLKSDENNPKLSSFIKKLDENRFDIVTKNAGFPGPENLYLESTCGIGTVMWKDGVHSNSNSWVIFKLTQNEKKEICFAESLGISSDPVANQDIFVLFYGFTDYDTSKQSYKYGRKLPFKYCNDSLNF